MPIDENETYEREKLIKQGQHEFIIDDLENVPTYKEGKEYHYLHFNLLELKTNEPYNNLMRCPLNEKKRSFSENSKFYDIMSKFGIDVKEHEHITGKMMNMLIGRRFSALVIYIDKFSEIDIKSIMPMKESSTTTSSILDTKKNIKS